jgi:hypothetical protein
MGDTRVLTSDPFPGPVAHLPLREETESLASELTPAVSETASIQSDFDIQELGPMTSMHGGLVAMHGMRKGPWPGWRTHALPS